MIKIENHCVDCKSAGLRCIGSSCPNRSVEVLVCDRCGEEIDPRDAYEVDGETICYECRLEELEDEHEAEGLA